jgi:hypothetical protein
MRISLEVLDCAAEIARAKSDGIVEVQRSGDQ